MSTEKSACPIDKQIGFIHFGIYARLAKPTSYFRVSDKFLQYIHNFRACPFGYIPRMEIVGEKGLVWIKVWPNITSQIASRFDFRLQKFSDLPF